MRVERYSFDGRRSYFEGEGGVSSYKSEWFFGEDQIAIALPESLRALEFTEGFMTQEGILVLSPNHGNPSIWRTKDCIGEDASLSARDHGGNIEKLINFIQENGVVYAFLMHLKCSGNKPDVLVFSRKEPDEKYYKRGKPLEVYEADSNGG